MGGKEEEYRVFVGGLSGEVTKHQLEDAFNRFGKILDSQVMLERDTGRPRGFGFLTYADRRAMDDAIREMHGMELGDRVISVNKAIPRMGGGDDPGNGYSGGGYSSGGRGSSFGGGDRSLGQDECFKCGRPGHWARDCPLAGGAQFSSCPRFGGTGGRYGDRDRFIDDRYDGGRYGDRDWYDSRDSKYGRRDRYINDRHPPSSDRFGGERYSDRYPVNGYRKEREYDRDGHSSSDRYGGGPTRGYQGKSYRDRAVPYGPYDRPRRGSGRPPSYNRY